MPEKENIVGATHNFHSEEYVRLWAKRFEVTPERLECFEHIGNHIERELNPTSLILELGTGPGYLARYLLERFDGITYQCLDFSDAMLGIARENLKSHSSRTIFQRIDLLEPSWEKEIERTPAAIVSTWALHDLGSKENVAAVYCSSRKLLSNGGILLNADFVKPEGIEHEFEEGRFLISQHLEYLKDAGFTECECTQEFEQDLENPAPHNNYSCLKGKT